MISCYSDDTVMNSEHETNSEINHWTYKMMDYYYYWDKEIPKKITDYETPVIDFFKSLLHEKDRFSESFIKDNIIGESINTTASYGFESMFGYIDENKTNICGLILYVYPGSTAEKEGIKRGDVFNAINYEKITIHNIEYLYSLKEAVFTFNRYNIPNTIKFEKRLSQNSQDSNPIHKSTIINNNNDKIGYICYNRFIEDSGDGSEIYTQKLLDCFNEFRKNNINELVVDLRYNPGGLIHLSVLFASLIVPNIDTTKVALHLEYNDNIKNLAEVTTQYFSFYPESYIGDKIKRVFFIVGPKTASASEALINALKPYMDVILVGESTYGKNYGTMLFSKKNGDKIYYIMPVVLKSFNSSHESYYDNGFTPNFYINELELPLLELGNPNETILNHILTSLIDGSNTKSNKVTNSDIRKFYFKPEFTIHEKNKVIYEIKENEMRKIH